MNSKDTCLALLDAQTEAAVTEIVASLKEMANPKNWTPLDRRETNYNVTTNQQASGPKAATELMTNMVDAVLLKEARKAKIDPKGPDAPQTMHLAVERFLKLKGGRMLNADSEKWLADFAEKNLVVGITGARSKTEGLPCYTFIDNGEGQNPAEFENTFLSLSSGNKKDVPFVQGKFNMGSSGVLSYCGEHWYKLIVSRKWDSKGPWGWTLLRRRPGDGVPIAEYFKPGGQEKGVIQTAEMETIFPLRSRTGERYARCSLSSGTVVKLYDFHVGAKFMGFRGARESLIEHLADTILPFKILDLRQTPTKGKGEDRALGVDPRHFYGMEYQLRRPQKGEPSDTPDEDDEAAAEDEKIGVDIIDDPSLGHIEIAALRLKRKLPGWLASSNNRVFHAVNGQVQFKQTRGFLTTCKLPALKDRVVIVVDASNLTDKAHNDVWKADRESVRETGKGAIYKELVRDAIQSSAVLQNLQNEIAKEELKTAVDEKSNDLFQKLVEGDKTLAALLGARSPSMTIKGSGVDDVKSGKGKGKGNGDEGGADDEKPYDGKYSPTKLIADKRFREKGMNLPINKSRPMSFETDVRNDYFVRDDNQGRLELSDPRLAEKFVIRRSLRDGRLIVYLNPVADKLAVGDTFIFEVGLVDDSMSESVTDEVTVHIVAEETDKPKSKITPKEKTTSGRGADKPNVGLPPYRLLTSDARHDAGQDTFKWPDWMDDHDGGYVEDMGGDGKQYYINLDNTWLQSYRKAQRGQILKDGITQKYILGMRVFLLGMERALSTIETDEDFDPDKFRRLAAKGASSTMLTLSDHLPKIITPVLEPE